MYFAHKKSLPLVSGKCSIGKTGFEPATNRNGNTPYFPDILYIRYADSAMVYDMIRNTVQACLPGSGVLLFGSRARGDHNHLSDYDLLIITPLAFTPQEKIYWSTRLDRAIIEAVHVPVDLLLNSENEVRRKQQLPGHIIRSAIREGVAL